MEAGRRYELEPGAPEWRVMDFEHYAVRTEDSAGDPAEQLPNRMSLIELLAEDSNAARGELVWRIGMPVSALLLSLLAIPLSYVNPRAGRSANMLMAILIYAIYSNLMSASQAWVAQGKPSFWVGACAVHLLMLLPLVILFHHRMAVRAVWRGGRA